jgi:hypothetical protein
VLVKLREGHEPLVVNTDNVATMEGTQGGRATLISLCSGGAVTVQMAIDDVLRAIKAQEAHDWIDAPEPRRGNHGKR